MTSPSGIEQHHARPAGLPAAGDVTPQGMELRHLRYFVAVADAGTFTHAAERLFIAQPTLSQQIRRLEQVVGTPLLRCGRPPPPRTWTWSGWTRCWTLSSRRSASVR